MADTVSPEEFFGKEAPQSKGFHPLATYKRRVSEATAQMQSAVEERNRREAQRARQPFGQQMLGQLNPLRDMDLTGRFGMGALQYVTSPVNMAFEEIVGRPGSTLTGGRVSPATIGDIAQLAIPFVGEGVGALRTAAAAKKAGTTAQGWLRQQIALEKAQRVLAADRAAVLKAQKPPSVTARALGPIVAKFSPNAAQKQAEQQLARSTTDIPAAQQALSRSPEATLPGDKPTLYEVTADPGQGALQTSLTKDAPGAFTERLAQQASAREDALRGIQAGADPLDVAKELQAQVASSTAAKEAEVAAAQTRAAEATSALGGVRQPSEIGANIQTPMSEASRKAQQEANTAWQAIDPDKSIPAQAGGVAQEAEAIEGSIGRMQAGLSGEEQDVVRAAQTVTNETSIRDLLDLRARIAAVMRAEMNKGSATYARLSRLKGTIEDNLAENIGPVGAPTQTAENAVSEAAVLPETEMLSEDAISAKLAQAVEAWRNPDKVAQQNLDKWTKEFYERKAAEIGAPAAEKAAADLAAARQQIAEATALTRQHAETYRTSPVRQVLSKEGTADRFAMMTGDVPGQFFVSGDVGFNTMQKALKANPEALPLLEDYAGHTLLREAVDPQTGAIDPAKFARWQTKYSEALRAFPSQTQQRFADAAEAQRAANETAAAASNAAKEQQQGVLGEILGLKSPEDIRNVVGAKLRGRTAVADMQALADSVAGNPDAAAGLRQAVVDYIGNTVIGSTGIVDLNKLNKLVLDRKGALNRVLSSGEIDTLEQVVNSLQRSRRAETGLKALPEGARPQVTVLDALLKHLTASAGTAMGATVGATVGHVPGAAAGAALGGMLGAVVDALRAQGVNNAQQLLAKLMLDPELARAALLRATTAKNATGAKTDERLLKVLSRLNAAGSAAQATAPPRAVEGGTISPEDFFSE